jgi:hypothetical protein
MEAWEPELRYHKDPDLQKPAFPDIESPIIRRKGLVESAKKGTNFEEEVLKRLDGAKIEKPKLPPPKSLQTGACPPFWEKVVEKSDLPSTPKTEFPPPMLVERAKPTPLPAGALYPGDPALLRATPRNKPHQGPPTTRFSELTPEVVRTDQSPPLLSTRPLPNQPPNVMLTCTCCQQLQPASQLKACLFCQKQICQKCKQTTMEQVCPICRR